MCTMAAIRRGSRSILLKNVDLSKPVPVGWTTFEPFDEDYWHFAVINHGQIGVNLDLNEHGLALQISQSGRRAPTPEREELRTALSAEVLARCTTVEQAVEELETYVREHPAMLGGNVMLGDSRSISVTEYFGGNAQSRILEEGVLIRANHSVFGLAEKKSEDSENRYDEMAEFSKALYDELDNLDLGDAIGKAKARLRTPPLLRESTRSSFVISVETKRVVHMVGKRPWQSFSFPKTS